MRLHPEDGRGPGWTSCPAVPPEVGPPLLPVALSVGSRATAGRTRRTVAGAAHVARREKDNGRVTARQTRRPLHGPCSTGARRPGGEARPGRPGRRAALAVLPR